MSELRQAIEPPRDLHQPVLSCVPPYNDHFTGREQELSELRAALSTLNAVALTQPQVICGLGGVGKTQTALTYAYKYRTDYSAILWLKATSAKDILSGFLNAANVLGLEERRDHDLECVAQAVLSWLEESTRWLVVFDGADNPEILRSYISRLRSGHVIVTSRAQVFDSIGIAGPIEISVMSVSEALTFLARRTARELNSDAEAKAAQEIAEQLGYLPLALEQAGAYINTKESLFADYLRGYRQLRLRLLEQHGPVAGEYPESVATTWTMNFAEVEEVSAESAHVLKLSAFFAADNIPSEVVEHLASHLPNANSQSIQRLGIRRLSADSLLEPLRRYSLVIRDLSARTYSIHRLVQEVVRSRMDPEIERAHLKESVDLLVRLFPKGQPSRWHLCERLLPHATRVAERIGAHSIDIESGPVLLELIGDYSTQRGQHEDAIRFGKKSLKLLRRIYRNRHPKVVAGLDRLAMAHYCADQYREAEPLYRDVLEMQRKLVGSRDLSVAASIVNLAECLRQRGKFTEAADLFVQGVGLIEAMSGPKSSLLSVPLTNMAGLYTQMKNYSKAEEHLKRAIAVIHHNGMADTGQMALALLDLAINCASQRRYPEAFPLFEKAFEIRQKVFGKEHYSVAQVLKCWASALQAAGQAGDAEVMMSHASRIVGKRQRPRSHKLHEGLR